MSAKMPKEITVFDKTYAFDPTDSQDIKKVTLAGRKMAETAANARKKMQDGKLEVWEFIDASIEAYRVYLDEVLGKGEGERILQGTTSFDVANERGNVVMDEIKRVQDLAGDTMTHASSEYGKRKQ